MSDSNGSGYVGYVIDVDPALSKTVAISFKKATWQGHIAGIAAAAMLLSFLPLPPLVRTLIGGGAALLLVLNTGPVFLYLDVWSEKVIVPMWGRQLLGRTTVFTSIGVLLGVIRLAVGVWLHY